MTSKGNVILNMINTYVLAGNVIALSYHKNGTDVLLVKRGCDPQKGRWAFPGGHIEAGEDLFVGSMRELKEETGLDAETADNAELCGVQFAAHDGHMVFYYIIKFFGAVPPLVRGADDAEEARWTPLNEALETELAFDHTAILNRIIAGDFWSS